MIESLRRRLDEVDEIDRGITRWIGQQPPSPLDVAMKGLSAAANHSMLWFAIAAALAVRKGATRRAALRGVLAIAATSFTANTVLKPLLPRRRPPANELPAYQLLPDPPTSSSFPSGHAASAAAFTTAVALECPKAGLAIAPLAAAVAYSRVHVGVHWTSDVLAGAAVGSGIALSTQRWWPVRRTDEAWARPLDQAPALPAGAGLMLVANPRSGDPEYDPTEEIAEALPAATVLRAAEGIDLQDQIEDELAATRAGSDGSVRAIGVAGDDGTVAAAAAVAGRRGLPLVMVPTGTLNHFARDVGVYDLQEAVDAVQAGEAVAVDLGVVDIHGGGRAPHDIRYLRADRRFSRTRAIIALALGALRHTRTYVQCEAPSLDVELLGGNAMLSTDGEVRDEAGRFTFRVAERPIAVYRRNEENWPDRPRPHLRW